MERREYLAAAGSGVAALAAGCASGGNDGNGTGDGSGPGTSADGGATTGSPNGGEKTLVVGTYDAFVDAPSTSPGAWLKERFESEFEATLEWQTPETGVNYYIERGIRGVPIDADLYVGLDTNMLIQVDDKLDGGLFAPVEKGALSRRDEVKQSLEFDPKGRAVPYDTGYICLVYNAKRAVAPKTFDGLLKPEYEGELIVQNPTSSATGKAFLLHTIEAKGEDGYLDYWRKLADNGVKVLGSWSDSYAAYTNGEAAMVVSYSTDQVYAHRETEGMSESERESYMKEHQIRFLNDQGYANPEGMARFAGSGNVDSANRFMDFVLSPEIQAGIAVRNVQFPATTTAKLPEEFAKYAKEPPESVTFTYEELQGNVDGWVDAWARQFASK
jgi:thiamine transport system substrate-binding protein